MLEAAYKQLLAEVNAAAMPSPAGWGWPYSPESAPCTPVLRPQQLSLSSPVSSTDFPIAPPHTPGARPVARQLWPDAAKKAEEAKKKGWVTTGFVWPDKKVDVGFESTGSKELDAEDAAEGRQPWPGAAQSGHLAAASGEPNT